MSSRNLIAVALLALALLVGGGAMVVHAIPGRTAAGDGPGGDNIAVVDIERLYNSSDLPMVLAQKSAQIAAQAQERVDALGDARFLDAKELQEYGDLISKVQPDAAQQTRIKELKALSNQRSTELSTLNVKPAEVLTAADKTRMRALVEMSHLLEKVLPSVQNELAQDQSDRLRAIRRDQITQLRAIVGQVAKEKGVLHVFDANALVYSANDLTPLVLKKLKPGK
jgi:Skp family chaperone for outer membrane proteins